MIRTRSTWLIKFVFITIFLFFQSASAETVNQIQVKGNERIPSETIKTFSGIKKKDDLDDNKINDALKSLYDSNFFKNVSIEFKDGKLTIAVVENPIIQNLEIEGVKAQKIRDQFFDNLQLKQRGSFFEENLRSDRNKIKKVGKNLGYYFIEVEALQETLDGNKVNITFNVDI